jgi:hypothetical protein
MMSSSLFSYQASSAALNGPRPGRPATPATAHPDRSSSETRQVAEEVGESGLLSDAVLQFRESGPSALAAGLESGSVLSPEQARQTLEATRQLILRQAPTAQRAHADLHPWTYSEWA